VGRYFRDDGACSADQMGEDPGQRDRRRRASAAAGRRDPLKEGNFTVPDWSDRQWAGQIVEIPGR